MPPGKSNGTHCIGSWVGPRAGLDGCGKSRPTGIRFPDRPALRELLYRLCYPAFTKMTKISHLIKSDGSMAPTSCCSYLQNFVTTGGTAGHRLLSGLQKYLSRVSQDSCGRKSPALSTISRAIIYWTVSRWNQLLTANWQNLGCFPPSLQFQHVNPGNLTLLCVRNSFVMVLWGRNMSQVN